jgi:hypothetical protein
MRSFTGMLLHALVEKSPVILIDEPEAFLHPPQAQKIAKLLLANRAGTQQILIATHSGDVLRGLLNESSEVKVIRITRAGDSNEVRELLPSDVKKLWSDPLLRHSNILDGLFHELVVVCEADSDVRFYSALAATVVESPDLMFVHCGGKHRMPMVIRALRKLGVPVAAVFDFDALRETSPLRDAVEAAGGDWKAVEVNFRKVQQAIEGKKPEFSVSEAKEEVQRALEGFVNEANAKEVQDKIDDVFRRSSPWSVAKRVGRSYVPSGDPTRALEELLSSLREMGLHIVPSGELESFVRSIGGKGPRWVNDALQSDLSSSTFDDARTFVKRVIQL